MVTVRTTGYPADEPIRLVTASRSLDIEDLVLADAPVPLPDEDFAFELRGDDYVRRVFPFTREQALAAGVVHLRWYRPTRVEGRVVGPDGAPRAVELALLSPGEAVGLTHEGMRGHAKSEGAIELSTEHEGLAVLAIVDDHGDLPARLIPVLLPPRGDDVAVDVGTITLADRPQYLLRDVDGELLDAWQVLSLRRGFVETDGRPHVRLHAEGWAPVLDLEPGDVLHVEPIEDQPRDVDGRVVYDVPARFRVRGAGPWDFTRPRGELWVDVRGSDEDTHARLFVDDLCVDLREPMLLRGLIPGRHRCFVCAAGHRTAIVDVEVPAEGTARLELQLPRR
jgi:hypothetical protein